jgi:hypothetical protein
LACRQRKAGLLLYWKTAINNLDEYDLGNKSGRSRTEHENKLVLCLLLMLIKTNLQFVEEGKMNVAEVSWTRLYNKISTNLHVRRQHVAELHKQMLEVGDILVLRQGEGSKRGREVAVYQQLEPEKVQLIVYMDDQYHIDGRRITN